jgi:glycosyltransferase involved in cell wall biosynthesis
MQSLRIIVVMIEPPLPFGNAAARWYYVLLKGLVERGHRVTAFATCSKPAEIEEAKQLFSAPAYDLRCYTHPRRTGLGAKWETLRRPYSYMFSPRFRSDLEAELARGFDVLHLEQLWSGWMGLAHTDRAVINVHYLPGIDLADTGTSVATRLALRAERMLLRRFPRFSALSPRLAEAVRRANSSAEVSVTPLGMDTSLYPFQLSGARRPPTVSLIGSFDWLPTLNAGIRTLTRLWPGIRALCPEAKLQFVGRQASLIRTRVPEKFLDEVSIVENVPDILPYFRATDVLLYPAEQASGMKVKVMEAFALGVPVVTTGVGVEGLPAVDGVHAGIAEDDAGLIGRTVELLRDAGLCRRHSMAARQLVESICGSAHNLDLLEQIYRQVVSHNLRQGSGIAASAF